ncbi:hypothetical protein [Longimicrobium terrae]|uniref:Uncharacterized protein n=1 Tax=Longimicrobium terrae TaxID=1639882 RepID=A0A841H1L8_9BACT|nr:hypothetical protein [Longimicrobium terrae]MBB4637503.1 hypothetical protein [Longimicrobium terrae]MBB6071900.1 hypothetical protein [Longimicrobium terrae]NNC30450.1 hypothetical protein [Longimicrobium terrae]
MPEKSIKQIVEDEMPDVEIVEEPTTTRNKGASLRVRAGASIAELRKKYLGDDYGEELFALSADSNDHADDEDDIVVKNIKAKRSPADPADDPGPRSVIVSRTRGIIGLQG